MMNGSRKISFDVLRIIAAFSVVMLHVCGNVIFSVPVGSSLFNWANFLDSINRFGVPIFVMISGALFLDKSKKTDVKRLWLHNILRFAVIYAVWSTIYYLATYEAGPLEALRGMSLSEIVDGILHADAYYWFFLMLMMLYALSPVIKKWIEGASRSDVEYFLILFIVFTVIIDTVAILSDSYILSQIVGKISLGRTIGYFGYFVLGYYFANYEISRKIRVFIYSSVPFDIVVNYLSSYLLTQKRGVHNPGVYDSFGFFTLMETAALFLFITGVFKDRESDTKGAKIIRNIAADTLGVYLIHVILVSRVGVLSIIGKSGLPVLWIIPYAIVLFVITAVVAAILRRVPLLGKYIC